MTLGSITEARCARCGHPIDTHMAEDEHPELPGMMPCEAPGCECVDFHRCLTSECPECLPTASTEVPRFAAIRIYKRD